MPTNIPIATPAIATVCSALAIWNKVVAVIRNPDFNAVAAFSITGLLLTILIMANLMLRFPDIGTLIEQYNQM
jgi:hypothetical protein